MSAPQFIFLIRHAEKPVEVGGTTYDGIDVTGSPNPHSLIPRGWQRAGGLATLFDTAVGTMRTDLAVPGRLYSPDYSKPGKTINHRTYETILPLSRRLGLAIDTSHQEGQEAQLAAAILASGAEVCLVAWEHGHIPAIAAAIPVVAGTAVPTAWPVDRFDVVWRFTLAGGDGAAYRFAALPQSLLAGDGPV
ncbi:hypothetical protein [Tsukamurella soli]|uniref:Histidine phosphatase family protein n=1 Tax=Tsukamurella soli TaxID=644556 RepID=A0ABP8JRJ6_9ACTN